MAGVPKFHSSPSDSSVRLFREVEGDPHILFSEALWEAWSNAKLPQPFAIEIRAEGFKPHRVEFDLTQMPQTDGPHILELGTVKVEATP